MTHDRAEGDLTIICIGSSFSSFTSLYLFIYLFIWGGGGGGLITG